jgi:DNA-binding CsgD family transcriptional regulator
VLDALDEVLLTLYRLARGTPPPAFKDRALAAVRAHLPFDAAGWGTFAITRQGARVHSVHLLDLPMAMMADYEAVKQHDTLSVKALAEPGKTINVSIDATDWVLHPDMVAHVRKWGLDHSLGTVFMDPALNLCNALSFYRGPGRPAFTAQEQRFKQRLMVHLVEAWNQNALRYVDRPEDSVDQDARAWALVDKEGMIYNGDPGLSALLGREFMGWVGPCLPTPMVDGLRCNPPQAYLGQHLVAGAVRVLADGLRLVRVRPLAPADRLSARERTVARQFADGRTHKEIAQALGVTPSTVRNQLQSAYQKLNVSSKVELIRALPSEDLTP